MENAMGKLVVSENVTLDGVVQDPTGEEGFEFGGWFNRIGDKDREAWAKLEFEEALASEALLLGGRTYEYFATRWASREGEWAQRLRDMPKYVVSSSLGVLAWGNSMLLEGDVAAEAAALKQRLTGDIVVYGSGRLVHTLMEHDLVDELRLTVYPSVLGSGARLFDRTSHDKPLRLLDARTVGDGLVFLTYRVLQDA
jgi:dihydrofolate reductase